MLAFWGWYVTGSLAVKRELFMTAKGCPTCHHAHKTQEHMKLQRHQHFSTYYDPSCSLHSPTNLSLHWIGTAKTMDPKKAEKCRNMELPCFDKHVLGRGGGGLHECCRHAQLHPLRVWVLGHPWECLRPPPWVPASQPPDLDPRNSNACNDRSCNASQALIQLQKWTFHQHLPLE